MSDDKRYNGWTNYETWNVALWLNNEEGSYRYWRGRADEALNEAEGDKEDAALALSRQLEEEVKDGAPDLGASTYSDLLGAALSEVNWYEIAENWLADCEYEAEPEEEEVEG